MKPSIIALMRGEVSGLHGILSTRSGRPAQASGFGVI